jgi:hypothetical protein
MKLDELVFKHSTGICRCYTTTYWGDRICNVVKSKSKKGLYKIVVTQRIQGTFYPCIGSRVKRYASPVYTVGKLYTQEEIRKLYKLQNTANDKQGDK